MTHWTEDKRWSDRFLPEIKSALGLHLIGEPPVEEDAERNTDLMVLRMDAVRVGCRIRRHNYLARYGDGFTIRAGRPSGVKTELTKIIEGWGDYFFYGFSDAQERRLAKWTLADLKVFRLWINREILRTGRMPGDRRANHDGSSELIGFYWADLPPEFVIGGGGAAIEEAA